MNIDDVKIALTRNIPIQSSGAAVLIPLVEGAANVQIILELRAYDLDVQPGEVCLPGGRIEQDETPWEAAVRETCEELLLEPHQIEFIADMGSQPGPGGMPLYVFVGKLSNYKGSYSPAEVDHTFTLDLDWLLQHDPTVYDVRMTPSYPDDYPWELIPGGRSYPWRAQVNQVPFYLQTEPLIWGATARVLKRFAHLCRTADALAAPDSPSS